jgi:hypothetical protein
LRTLSPKTRLKSNGGALHFLNTTRVATGSIADIKEPKRSASVGVKAVIQPRFPSQIRIPPVAIVAISVPPIASNKMTQKFEKKPLRCVLKPASKIIGGNKPKNKISGSKPTLLAR